MDKNNNNKNGVTILVIFLCVAAAFLIYGMVVLAHKGIDYIFNIDIDNKKMELVDSFESNDITNINFELYSTDVYIEESVDNNFMVEYYSNKEVNDKLETSDNTIILKEDKSKNVCFGICYNQRKVIIYVPNDYGLSFDITSISGDIKSSINLIEDKINIVTTSGDITLLDTTDINLVTTSGNIRVGKTNEAKINTTSGDIIIDDSNKLKIKTTSGNIKISRVNDSLDIDTTSGNITINNLGIVANSYINSTSGDVKINNNVSNCYIDYSSVSGDEHIDKNNRKSDIVLKVKTISGDISVN